jgi:hypothetical protein
MQRIEASSAAALVAGALLWIAAPVTWAADAAKQQGANAPGGGAQAQQAPRAQPGSGSEPAGSGGQASGTVDMPTIVISAGTLAANPTQYYGKKVSIRSEVEDLHGQNVFTLDEDNIVAAPDILVLNPRPASAVEEDTVVTVIGVVRPFVEGEFERDYAWFKPEPALEARFERRPAVIAESIRTATGTELVQASPGAAARAQAD